MLSVNLFVPNVPAALAYYEKAFGAAAVQTDFESPKGEKSALFTIDGDRFALADENPAWGSKSALTLGGAPMCIQIFVNDVSSAVEQTLAAGAKLMAPSTPKRPVLTLPDGTEFGNVIDPFGFVWSISKETEE